MAGKGAPKFGDKNTNLGGKPKSASPKAGSSRMKTGVSSKPSYGGDKLR